MTQIGKLFAAALISTSALLLATTPGVAKGSEKASFVKIDSGPIQGVSINGVDSFLGIPYAAPPVGALRWRPPQPPEHWDFIRPTVRFRGTCPQTKRLGAFANASDTEDCLYLNVYTDRQSNSGKFNPNKKKPVMVWIYGGGLTVGASNDYDGTLLAKNDVVVVTVNYRLGILGFFSHPAFPSAEQFSNYGFMDQQYALQWVKRNIAAFGGDPNNVTIFGESSGGHSVMAQIVSPAAKGLFHKAISQSGAATAIKFPPNGGTPEVPAIGAWRPLSETLRLGTGFANAAGCTDQSMSCLRSLSVRQILDVQAPYTITAGIVDGRIIPLPFQDAITSGRFNHVPFINGTNLDEWRWSAASSEINNGVMTAQGYVTAMQSFYGPALAARVMTEYPISAYSSPALAYGSATTDSLMACPQRKMNQLMSEKVPVYGFEFADRTAPSYLAPVSFDLGAAHTFEIQYLFPYFNGGSGTPRRLNDAQERLSKTMIYYWTGLARAPVGKEPVLGGWDKYRSDRDNYLSFQLPGPRVTTTFANYHKCAFWDATGIY